MGRGQSLRIRKHIAEIVALSPDVILTAWGRDRGPLLQGDPHRTNRIGKSPIRSALVLSKAWAARRRRHRFHPVRIRYEWEMARFAQAGRALRNAGCGPS